MAETRILVVEDEQPIRDLIAFGLRRAGFEVALADTIGVGTPRKVQAALDAALRKALNGHFPNLAQMKLVDYKVRVINSEAGTAACVRVVIESRDEDEVWGTVGVSEKIIEASWIALVDSFEYKLYKDEGKKSAAPRTRPVPAAT